MSGLEQLRALHQRVAACSLCRDHLDPEKAARRPESVAESARIFIVAQALARDTQRVSGVPYFGPDGRLGSSGRSLESFLRTIGATLYPPTSVQLQLAVIPPAEPGLMPVYNSEILHCFPGRNGNRDRFPAAAARECLSQGFLAQEIALVRPALILVLGVGAARWFWQHFAGVSPPFQRLRDGIEGVVRSERTYRIGVGGLSHAVAPLIHPSGHTTALFRKEVMENIPLRRILIQTLQEASWL